MDNAASHRRRIELEDKAKVVSQHTKLTFLEKFYLCKIMYFMLILTNNYTLIIEDALKTISSRDNDDDDDDNNNNEDNCSARPPCDGTQRHTA